MSKTVLITRARGDEETLTEALHDYGINVIHEPLTDIFLLHNARAELEHALEQNPNAVLITSHHGARALAALTPLRDLPLLCVGDATQQAALSLAFSRACATGETVDDMIDYIRSAYDDDAFLLYAAADKVRTDISEALADTGMRTQQMTVYEAQPVEGLSEILIQHIKNGQLDAVTFLSQRAAQIFTELSAQVEMDGYLEGIRACCMSETIASALKPDIWQDVHIAPKPTLASLAKCVDNALR